MSHRNPARTVRPRPVNDTEALELLAGRLTPTDVEGIMRKTQVLTEIARLRLKELREASAALRQSPFSPRGRR